MNLDIMNEFDWYCILYHTWIKFVKPHIVKHQKITNMSYQTNLTSNTKNFGTNPNLKHATTKERKFSRSLVADEDPEPPENVDKSERFVNEL